MAYQGTTDPAVGATTAPSTTHEERKLAKEVNEEYHDPLDDWGSRDTLLSLVPFIVTFAMKDVNLTAAINFGIAWSAFLLIMRTVAYDSRRKTIWPMLDLTTLVAFAVLRGLNRHFEYWVYKWWTVIIPLIFCTMAILTLLWRRPFVAHYARYPKFDRGGRGLWNGDASYRRTADMATLGWITAWSLMLLFALIPILIGRWFHWGPLNIIFNYVFPFVFLAGALVFQQIMGSWYRSTASKAAATTVGNYQRGAGYPTGPTSGGSTAPTATYTSPV